MLELKQLAIKLLRDVADRIEAGTSEISGQQAMDIVSTFTHEPISKDNACRYLNLSRSRFDDLVRENKIPRGKKRTGFKEKVWYKDELDECIRKLKK